MSKKVTTAQIKKEMTRCVHFTGTQHDECRAGINYHKLLGDGFGCFAHMPCFSDDQSTVVCESRQLPTEAEARKSIEDSNAAVAEFLNQFAQGICQYCKVEVKQRQVGSCVYGSCGHRLYQGTVNPKFAE